MTGRKERVARNEAMTCEMNEEIEQAHPRSPDDHFRVICECGKPDRTVVIAIAVHEYEEVRSDARHFVVVGAPVMPDVEEVVPETERFTVVRKHEGTPAEIAEEADPRS